MLGRAASGSRECWRTPYKAGRQPVPYGTVPADGECCRAPRLGVRHGSTVWRDALERAGCCIDRAWLACYDARVARVASSTGAATVPRS